MNTLDTVEGVALLNNHIIHHLKFSSNKEKKNCVILFQNQGLQILIFLFYFLLFAWLITIIPFFKKSGIGKWLLIILFAIKIVAGFAYAFYFSLPQNIGTADTWKFYKSSLLETEWLLHNPLQFISDLFHSPYEQTSSFFSSNNSYWNDLKDNVIIKLMAVINVFTGKNYYTSIIVFNFLFLFGPVALYRIAQNFWDDKKMWLILPIFLLPSFLFWCSGTHKDGLIFSALLISIYCFDKQIKAQRLLIKYSLLMAACFIALFALRNVILFLLLPALFAWFVSETLHRYKWLCFTCFYAVGLIVFFYLPHLSSALNFPQYIVNKQTEFTALSGNSKVIVPALQPTFISFAAFFPYAVDIVFFRPHILDIAGINYLLSFLENSFLFLALVAWMLWHKPLKTIQPILIFFFFFSLSVWLLCGYTVMFTGAVVRYKSVVTPLVLLFIMLTVNYERILLRK